MWHEDALLTVQIKDDEIFELLERLAATEEMFKTPVSTIRDVAELTDASPNLIARILGEMRGPGELELVHSKLSEHEARLQSVERRITEQRGASSTNRISGDKSVPPIISNYEALPSEANLTYTKSKTSNEDWARYRKSLSENLSNDAYEIERSQRRQQITVGVVIIAIVFLLWVSTLIDPAKPVLPTPVYSGVEQKNGY